jgi:hypothetical protein
MKRLRQQDVTVQVPEEGDGTFLQFIDLYIPGYAFL